MRIVHLFVYNLYSVVYTHVRTFLVFFLLSFFTRVFVILLYYFSLYLSFMFLFFFFKQKTAYEMRISDWSSDVCSSDLTFQHAHTFGSMSVGEALAAASVPPRGTGVRALFPSRDRQEITDRVAKVLQFLQLTRWEDALCGDLPYGVKKRLGIGLSLVTEPKVLLLDEPAAGLNTVETSDLVEMLRELRSTGITILVIRSEEHTSELQPLMRISYAVFCLKK